MKAVLFSGVIVIHRISSDWFSCKRFIVTSEAGMVTIGETVGAPTSICRILKINSIQRSEHCAVHSREHGSALNSHRKFRTVAHQIKVCRDRDVNWAILPLFLREKVEGDVAVNGASSNPPSLAIIENGMFPVKPKLNVLLCSAFNNLKRTTGQEAWLEDFVCHLQEWYYRSSRAIRSDWKNQIVAFEWSEENHPPYRLGILSRASVVSRIIIIPAAPRIACSPVRICICGWYQYVDALFFTSNCACHVVFGSITVCGPPSAIAGTCNPCQWTVLVSLRIFSTLSVTKSPLFNNNVGPR